MSEIIRKLPKAEGLRLFPKCPDLKSKHFRTVLKTAKASQKLPKTIKCRPLFD